MNPTLEQCHHLCQDGTMFEFLPYEMKNRDLLLLAIESYPSAIHHATEEQRGDRTIIMHAFKREPRLIDCASYAAMDPRFLLEMVAECNPVDLWTIARYAQRAPHRHVIDLTVDVEMAPPKRSVFTLELAMAIVEKCGRPDDRFCPLGYNPAFDYFLGTHFNDLPLVLEALAQGNRIYHFAAEAIKRDERVILSVIENTILDFEMVPAECVDRNLARLAVLQSGKSFQFLSPEHKDDNFFLIAALKTSRFAYQYASLRIRSDKEMTLYAIQVDGDNLCHASDELKGDLELAVQAVGNKGHALAFVRSDLKPIRWIQVLCIHGLNKYEDPGIDRAAFHLTLEKLNQHFLEKEALMLGSALRVQVEEDGKKKAICFDGLKKLNAHGPFMAVFLKKKISSFLDKRTMEIPFINQWCDAKRITAKDVLVQVTAIFYHGFN